MMSGKWTTGRFSFQYTGKKDRKQSAVTRQKEKMKAVKKSNETATWGLKGARCRLSRSSQKRIRDLSAIQ